MTREEFEQSVAQWERDHPEPPALVTKDARPRAPEMDDATARAWNEWCDARIRRMTTILAEEAGAALGELEKALRAKIAALEARIAALEPKPATQRSPTSRRTKP